MLLCCCCCCSFLLFVFVINSFSFISSFLILFFLFFNLILQRLIFVGKFSLILRKCSYSLNVCVCTYMCIHIKLKKKKKTKTNIFHNFFLFVSFLFFLIHLKWFNGLLFLLLFLFVLEQETGKVSIVLLYIERCLFWCSFTSYPRFNLL